MIKVNQDGTFFKVESDDFDSAVIAAKDAELLEVTESMGELDSGTVVLHDPFHHYSRILRPGSRMSVSWGQWRSDGTIASRSPVDAIINSPSGSGNASGKVTYNCTFMALNYRGEQAVRRYESGTKGDVVVDVMARIGIAASNRFIQFERMRDTLQYNQVMQYESDFRFLVRLADECRAAFRIGRRATGELTAIFCDYGLLLGAMKNLQDEGGSLDLKYGCADANVLSYVWADHSYDSAYGQGARLVMIDGQPVIYRTVVEGETITTYRLVPELIEAEQSALDFVDRTTLLMEYLSYKDFEQVRRFFVVDSTTTSPQGSGIEVNLELMGDPYVTSGMVASFSDEGVGFPGRIGTKDRTWWVQKATHSISAGGYFTSVTVKDAWSFSETGVKIPVVGGGSL